MATERNQLLLAAALDAVARGWRVFPLRPGGKKPALHSAVSCPGTGVCRDGHRVPEQRAFNDPDVARWCWTSPKFAGCNVAVATGPSDLVVVDLDMPKPGSPGLPESFSRRGAVTGMDVFALVCADAGQPVPEETFTVRSARGGRHLYFRAPAEVRLRITEGEHGLGLGPLIDTRAWGGYVVAPGSITHDGRYDVIRDVPVADLPGWLVRRLSSRPAQAISAPNRIHVDRLNPWVAAAVRGEQERVATAPPGHGRALFISGATLGELVGAGALPPAEAEEALYEAAFDLIQSGCGCTEREVRRAIRNGIRLGTTRPRPLPSPTGRYAA
jgi:hypothetical protein